MLKINITNKSKKIGTKQVKPKSSLFSEEDDEDETIMDPKTHETVLAEQIRNKSKGKIQERLKQALEEDPTVFDYDSVLPDISAKRNEIKAAKKAKNAGKKSKYIDVLLAKAEQRNYELERVRETQILKQIEAEKEIYGEKESYVTNKYKKHLEERRKWEEKQDKIDSQDEDVTKKDMGSFYYSMRSKLHETESINENNSNDEKKSNSGANIDKQEENNEISHLSTDKRENNDSEETKDEMETDGEGKNVEKSPEEKILTREEKVEAAKQRYFERRAKKARNK